MDDHRAALNERGAKLGAYAEAAGSLLGRDLEPEGVVDALTEWEAEVERSVSEAETEAATARGRADGIRESIAQLNTAEAVCRRACARSLSMRPSGPRGSTPRTSTR